jgi:hypothetical protein
VDRANAKETDVRLWRHGDRRTATGATGRGKDVDHDDDGELDELDDLATLGELAGPADQGGAGAPGARPAGGPVLLTLTTREQVEKAAAAEAAPKMVRVRPGRGAFGGTAAGGGCAH